MYLHELMKQFSCPVNFLFPMLPKPSLNIFWTNRAFLVQAGFPTTTILVSLSWTVDYKAEHAIFETVIGVWGLWTSPLFPSAPVCIFMACSQLLGKRACIQSGISHHSLGFFLSVVASLSQVLLSVSTGFILYNVLCGRTKKFIEI